MEAKKSPDLPSVSREASGAIPNTESLRTRGADGINPSPMAEEVQLLGTEGQRETHSFPKRTFSDGWGRRVWD